MIADAQSSGRDHPLYVPTETYERIVTALPLHPLDLSLAYHTALSNGTVWETLEAERTLLSAEVSRRFSGSDSSFAHAGHMSEVFSLLFKVGVFAVVQGVRETAGLELPVRRSAASPLPPVSHHSSSVVSGMSVPYNSLPETDPGSTAQSNVRHGIRYWVEAGKVTVFDEPVLELESSGDSRARQLIGAAGNSVFFAMLRSL